MRNTLCSDCKNCKDEKCKFGIAPKKNFHGKDYCNRFRQKKDSENKA